MTTKIGILAQSGAGKTNTGVILAEEVHKCKQHVVVLDAKGDWWGIRADRDGTGPGLPWTVFGGQHADIPIYPENGALVAKTIVDKGINAVVDVSDFDSDAQRHRFTTDFAKAFYQEKKRQRQKTPVLLVLEEADESLPQQMVEPTEAAMVGAIKRIIKLGRFCGIGILIITQRSADVNKKGLSQIEVLIAMRVWSPTDVKTIDGWLKDQCNEQVRNEILSALPSLQTGEGYVVSPKLGILKRVQFRMRETFDAGETPKVGETKREPKVLAQVELDELEAAMRDAVEKAKADDPKELRRRLAAAEGELARLRNAKPATVEQIVEKIVHVPVYDAGDITALTRIRGQLKDVGGLVTEISDALHTVQVGIEKKAAEKPRPLQQQKPAPLPNRAPMVDRVAPADGSPHRAAGSASPEANGDLAPADRRVLDNLAWLETIGQARPDMVTVAVLCEASSTSSSYTNRLGRLRTLGYLEAARGDGTVSLTGEGRSHATYPKTPPTKESIWDSLQRKLSPADWKVLEELIGVYSDDLAKGDLAGRVGASVTSSSFTNRLGRLRSCGLIDYPAPGRVKASPILFLGGATA